MVNTFEEIAALPDEDINLARAGLLIARDEYPNLDIEAYLKRIDGLASAVAERMPPSPDPETQIAVMNHLLFVERRFRGNTENYYDPRNSFLNDVIDRRSGIPITLSVLYIEIAARLELPISGVNMPGHFIVRYDLPGRAGIYIDPFNAGRILTEEDCHEMILAITGGAVHSSAAYLMSTAPRLILSRMLTNLKVIYQHSNDAPRAIRVLNRIIQLNPSSTNEFRERGLIHAALKQYRAALCDLITYLTNAPGAPDTSAVEEQIDRLLTEMHRRN